MYEVDYVIRFGLISLGIGLLGGLIYFIGYGRGQKG